MAYTRAKLIWEQAGKLCFEPGLDQGITLTLPDKIGIYDWNRARPVELRNGELCALMNVRTSAYSWCADDRLYVESGDQTDLYVLCSQGRTFEHVVLPGRAMCALDSDTIALNMESCVLSRVGKDGEVFWSRRLSCAECMRVRMENGVLYCLDRTENGVRIDALNADTGVNLHQWGHEECWSAAWRFVVGGIYVLVDAEQPRWVRLDWNLNELRSGASPVYGAAEFEVNAEETAIFAVDCAQRLWRLGLDGKNRACKVGKSDFLRSMDARGNLIVVSQNGMLTVFSQALEKLSGHRLGGGIAALECRENCIFVLTGSSQAGMEAWGMPDDCRARIYRIEYLSDD